MNIDVRKRATDDFEKYFVELMNHGVFEKL